MNRRFGKNDVIFISFLALFCIAVCVAVYKGGAVDGSNIIITIDGEEYGTYSLLEEQIIVIEEGKTKNVIDQEMGYAQ